MTKPTKDPRPRVARPLTASRTARAPDPPPSVDPFARMLDQFVAALAPRLAGALALGEVYYSQNTAPIARETYLQICREDRIPNYRVGKLVLVKRMVLHAWIEAHARLPRVKPPKLTRRPAKKAVAEQATASSSLDGELAKHRLGAEALKPGEN